MLCCYEFSNLLENIMPFPSTVIEFKQNLKDQPFIFLTKENAKSLLKEFKKANDATAIADQKSPDSQGVDLKETAAENVTIDSMAAMSVPLISDEKQLSGSSEDAKIVAIAAENKLIKAAMHWVEVNFLVESEVRDKNEVSTVSTNVVQEISRIDINGNVWNDKIHAMPRDFSIFSLRDRISAATVSRAWRRYFLPQAFRTNFIAPEKTAVVATSDKVKGVSPYYLDNLESFIKIISTSKVIIFINTNVLLSNHKHGIISYEEFTALLRSQFKFFNNVMDDKINADCDENENVMVNSREKYCSKKVLLASIPLVIFMLASTMMMTSDNKGLAIVGYCLFIITLLCYFTMYCRTFVMYDDRVNAFMPDRVERRQAFIEQEKKPLASVLAWLSKGQSNISDTPPAAALGDIKIDVVPASAGDAKHLSLTI